MKKLITILSAFCLLIFMNSCASLTGFEEGRTLDEGNSEVGVTFNYSRAPDLFGDELEGDSLGINSTIGFPNIEFNYKYGIMEKLDLGAKLSTNLNSSAYLKYQIVGDKTSNFALSPGIEVGSILGLAYYVSIPIYASYYPSESVALNINPRFSYQFATGDATTGVSYVGGNVGLLMGRKHKFGLDFGYYTVGSNSQRNTLLTFGVGGKFRFGDNMTSGSSNSNSNSTRKRR